MRLSQLHAALVNTQDVASPTRCPEGSVLVNPGARDEACVPVKVAPAPTPIPVRAKPLTDPTVSVQDDIANVPSKNGVCPDAFQLINARTDRETCVYVGREVDPGNRYIPVAPNMPPLLIPKIATPALLQQTKPFPWLLVAGGIGALGVAYLVFRK